MKIKVSGLVMAIALLSAAPSYASTLDDFISSIQTKDWSKSLQLFDYSNFFTLLAVLAIELVAVGYKRSSLKILMSFDKSVRIDLFYFFLHFFRLAGVFNLIVTFGTLSYFEHIKATISLNLLSSFGPIAQFAAALLIVDFMGYWTHRFLHWSSWLWECHKVHHSATELNLLMDYRFHPLDSLCSRLQLSIGYMVIGGPLEGYVIFNLLHQTFIYLTHARVQWGYGWLGRYIFISPKFHVTHHVNDPAIYNTNFGGTFVFWDKLFGTYHHAETISFDKLGVDRNSYLEEGILRGFLRPYRTIFARMTGTLPVADGAVSR